MKKTAKKPPVAIQYPTWKVRGGPTPNEQLVICDECGHAQWVPHTQHNHDTGFLCYNRHQHANGKNRRMRAATVQETAIGQSTIKEIIG